MIECSFREVQEEDLPCLLEIYNYYVVNTTATFHAKPLTEAEMGKLVLFEDEKYRSFVIMTEQSMAGYVILTQHKSREAYDRTGEVTVYLAHDFAGKGIGSAAVKFIEGFARQKGFHVLVATICGENQQSIGLFQRNGYEKCAHYKQVGRKFGQWLDVVAYQKLLEEDRSR